MATGERDVYFDAELNAWRALDGGYVCQDHATPEPCIFDAEEVKA